MISKELGSRPAIRDIIGAYLVELGERDDRVVAVTADGMATCRLWAFARRFPDRTFNVGIAEQNMVSFAAGLAHEGFLPYVFSMAPFMSMRAYEQCRTDVAYGNLSVRLLAPYAGCSGGISGATHWGMEDCAIMCAMPGMTVLEPCNAHQVKCMLDWSLEHRGPVYLRSSVEPAIDCYDDTMVMQPGKAAVPAQGGDGAFICAGVTVGYALEASAAIAGKTGKAIRVVDMHTIKPLDRAAVIDAARTGRVVAAQDHSYAGGLGSRCAEVIAQEGIAVHLVIRGMPDAFVVMAHAPRLYHEFGYDAEGLEKAMLELLAKPVFRN